MVYEDGLCFNKIIIITIKIVFIFNKMMIILFFNSTKFAPPDSSPHTNVYLKCDAKCEVYFA